jgi:adenylate kinase family enzyme
MDYCAALNFIKNKSDNQNVFETLFYPIKIDSYMQQHKIFEIICELMIRIGIDRPNDVVGYMITKLIEISNKFRRNVVTIEFDNCIEDASRMLKKTSCQSRVPIIECTKANLKEMLKKFCNHHLIICDFKNTPSNEKRMLVTTKSSSLSKSIKLKFCEENVKSVINKARFGKTSSALEGEWNRRILIVGRVGSGRKTQASFISQELNAIPIVIDHLRAEYEQQFNMTATSNVELSFWAFVQKTILKPDCLRRGYVIVSNVISRKKLQILMEKFIYPPNQIIFLHASENTCRQRISRLKGICAAAYQSALDTEAFLRHQMDLYDLHKEEFDDYFAGEKRKMIFHVNANGKIADVTNSIFERLTY